MDEDTKSRGQGGGGRREEGGGGEGIEREAKTRSKGDDVMLHQK